MHTHSSSPQAAAPAVDATSRIRPGERALVLGGGGATGNAWNIGVLAGLAHAGLDVVADADLLIGTSAGATAAAQVSAADPAELFAAIVAVVPPTRQAAPGAGPAASARVAEHLERRKALVASSASIDDYRRRLSAAALAQDQSAGADGSARWRATVAARLPASAWPDRQLIITVVDAVAAEPIVFDRDSGIDLVDAVAASCASGPAFQVGAQRYIDGGFRANAENADLTAGSRRVLVLSPFGGESLAPREWGVHLADQVEALRAAGSRVEILVPGDDLAPLFGANAMDVAQRAVVARAGWELGRAQAETLASFWGRPLR